MEKVKFQLRWPYFMVAFALGILYVYASSPPKTMVLQYPTPFNAGKIVYTDSANNCFVFDAIALDQCPEGKKVKAQPIIVTSNNR